MSTERFDPAPVLAQLKDFQRASVEHTFDQLYRNDASRFLVADEVGLGKTMVARGLIAKAIDHLWESTRRIDVIYICSNSSIAQQNIRRLNVLPDQGFSFSSRMTMIAREVAKLEANKVNFVSFTPGTSFDLKSSTGMGDERVLLYWLMRHVLGDSYMAQPGISDALRCGIGENNWPRYLANGELPRTEIDAELLDGFASDLEALDVPDRLATIAGAFATNSDSIVERRERDDLVGGLRARLASRCVTSLEPDLVILDEFQRFRHLMDPEDGAGALADQLFGFEDNKTLLLSATPYKMYTGGGDEEDHHRDFIDTVNFLFDGRPNEFNSAIDGFRHVLLDIHNRPVEEIRSARQRVEGELRKVMVRTERLGAGGDRNGMLVEVPCPAGLEPADVATYVGMERLAKLTGSQSMLAFWKSVPSFLNFSDGYKAQEQLVAALEDPATRAEARRLIESIESRIDWAKWRRFDELEPGNGRQRVLQEQTIGNDAWRMLWLAPSLPYHELGEPWTGERARFTKRLIFSSYVGVPRSICSLLSYEAERRMFGLRQEPIENSPASRQSIRGLLMFRRDPQGRPAAMTTFNLVYPSARLAELGDPLALAREAGRPLGLDELRAAVAARIESALDDVTVDTDHTHIGVDERWYWAAPILLDRAAGERHQMSHKRQYAGAWVGGSAGPSGEDDGESGSNQLFREHLALAKQMYKGEIPLGRRPDDLVEVLTDLALGAPGVVAARSMDRVFGTETKAWDRWYYSCRVAFALRDLFNLPDVNSMTRSADWEQDYWRSVIRYGADGCLTAVLDEFFHVLRESLGLFEIEPKRQSWVLEEFANAAQEAISTRTASLTAQDHIDESEATNPPRFRTRYAMRFGNNRAETDQSTATAANVRRSFNSPFWPFVLASTSVGQEGLDFHLYCHAIMHWNLPGNPVDLEQREGRVHRFKGHAIRRNLADDHAGAAWSSAGDPWHAMFDAAIAERADGETELVPFWIYPGESKIERHVPLLPLSRDSTRLNQLKQDVTRYRLVFGQPRQDDLLEFVGDLPRSAAGELRVTLAPDSTTSAGLDR